METEVDVDNKDLSISPGMYANTMLHLAEVKNVVTVPIEALVLSEKQQTVYALDGGNHIHIRSVAVGLEGSKLAEITNGLVAGDRVVVGGQDKYQENEEVSPLPASVPASETLQETGGMIDMKAEAGDGGAH
jgi:multidrug efflux pump subunit AcrA (membrane-fusion protein)